MAEWVETKIWQSRQIENRADLDAAFIRARDTLIGLGYSQPLWPAAPTLDAIRYPCFLQIWRMDSERSVIGRIETVNLLGERDFNQPWEIKLVGDVPPALERPLSEDVSEFGFSGFLNSSPLNTSSLNEAPIVREPSASGLGIEGYVPDIAVRTASGNLVLGEMKLKATAQLGLPPIWAGSGIDVLLQIDKARQELEAVRLLYRSLQADGFNASRLDNNPPEPLDAPDIERDAEIVELALSCLTVLRPLLFQPEPDIELLSLVWRAIKLALGAMFRLAAWAARLGAIAFKGLIQSAFASAYAKALGTTLGTGTGGVIIYEITQHKAEGLAAMEQALKFVMAAIGHPIS